MSLWGLGGWSCKWNITSSSCWSQEVKILFLDLCFWWKMLVECVYQYHPWYCVQGLTSNLVFKLTRYCRKLINIQICCIYSICDARYFHSQFSDIDRREGPFIKLLATIKQPLFFIEDKKKNYLLTGIVIEVNSSPTF